MIRPPPISTRTCTPYPVTTLFQAFLELDVLARDGIVLAKAHLLGRVARILLRNVEKSGVGSGNQPDLDVCGLRHGEFLRSEEHTSEPQSLMRILYAVFCLKKQKQAIEHRYITTTSHKYQILY